MNPSEVISYYSQHESANGIIAALKESLPAHIVLEGAIG